MKIEIDVSDLVERKADSRGRIAIGPEYANQKVTVAVLESEAVDNDGGADE